MIVQAFRFQENLVAGFVGGFIASQPQTVGGKTASEQVKGTLAGVKLRVAETRPALAFEGGNGPDLFAAIGGELTEGQKKAWEEKSGDEVRKAFGELTTLMEEVAAEKAKEQAGEN